MLINEMVIFYFVALQGSFSAAAKTLGMSKSYVSKHIAELENNLKVRLLNRTTRHISLTEAGEIFFQHCQSLSAMADEGFEAIRLLQQHPSGTLKISVPPALALHVLTPILMEYKKLHSDMKFNIVLESRIVDIVKEGYDLALRAGVLSDSTLISQKIADLSNILCATPKYLKKYGLIKHPEQLTEHVFATYGDSKSAKQFTFEKAKDKIMVNIDSHFQSNNLDVCLQLVMENACIARLPGFMVKNLIDSGKLISLLPEYKIMKSPLYVIYPNRKLIPLKVKSFIEVLKQHLSGTL